MPTIHPLAVVDPNAELADDVEVGPFCTVGPEVRLGPGNRLVSHVVIAGRTTVGEGNVFYPHCVLGLPPQDKKFRGETTQLIIGNRNSFREAVTLHVGTTMGGGFTRVGNDNLLMINCHAGHDVQIGSNCVLANNVMLAGHSHLGDNVNMSGGSGTHHFVSIGDFAFIAAMARLHFDAPPFLKIAGDDQVRGVNTEGLRRANVPAAEIQAIETACRHLFFNKKQNFAATLAQFDVNNGLSPGVKNLVQFLHRRDQGLHGRYLESFRTDKKPRPEANGEQKSSS